MQPLEAFDVQVISMGFLMPEGEAVVWRGPMLHKAIQQLFMDVAWQELDYLIVDLPPGTGDAQLSMAQSVPMTGAIIVTGLQAVAVSDARRGAAAFKKLEVPIKRLLLGEAADRVVQRDAMANPASLEWFVDFAARRSTGLAGP